MTDSVGQQFGNYRLLRLLGQGSFAAVYLGEHLYLERPAAIKVLHVQMEPRAHEAFRREAHTIARLQHPHIVQVHDFGIEGQTPYLVMEYAPNGTLRELHPKGTLLSLEQIILYVRQIASSLDYAHEQRVIHRDIKPANLLLNARNEVVLSDFGLSVVERTLESLSEQNAAGTPLYMAPEQIQHQPCAASDQYSLGVMVYEWLCGEPPFRGPSVAIFGQHLYQAPPSLCARLPHLSLAVEDAVFRALAKDPTQRFPTVQDFASVLEEACFARQPLSLNNTTRQGTHDQKALPAGPAPVERARDHSEESMHLRIMTTQPISSKSLLLPSAVTQSRAPSKLTKLSISQRNRQILLRKVHSFWIEGVLKHSLHGAALITLGLQAQPDAVSNPWHLVLQHPDTSSQPLSTGTRITQVYDDAAGELLILGAPGAGKTTLLLELTRDLLERAEDDEQYPIPVVFNLSSWAMKQPNLTGWLVEELNTKYQVPSKLGQSLVEADQILPLLDGLDEVSPTARTTCIKAINTYRQEHGLLPLVVCSRQVDYLAQSGRLLVRSAVNVQPLMQEQVDSYLAQGGEPLWALRVALQQDTALRELTNTPLMLDILTLTYHGKPVEELRRGNSMEQQQGQVFEQYVGRMLTRRGSLKAGTPQQVVQWLTYLASRMHERNQTVFYLEQLPPNWLSENWMVQVYNWISVRLPGILMGMFLSLAFNVFIFTFSSPLLLIQPALIGGLIGGLMSEGNTIHQPAIHGEKVKALHWRRLLRWLIVSALVGVGVGVSNVWGYAAASYKIGLREGLIMGLGYAIFSFLLQVLLRQSYTHTTRSRSQTSFPIWRTAWQRLSRGTEVRNGLLIGLLIGLIDLPTVTLNDSITFNSLFAGLEDGLSDGLAQTLCFGIVAGFLSVLLIGRSIAVQPTDRLTWSWRQLGRGLLSKSHLSVALWLATLVELHGLLGVQFYQWNPNGVLIRGINIGLVYWLLLGLFRAVSSETIEDQHRMRPNQGIHHSAINGLIMGFSSAAITGVVIGVNSSDVGSGIIIALSIGLLVGLISGGLACLQHYVLRFLLWRSGAMPWKLPRFLDAAAECILLRKVGGGYIFVHRLLLDYFAALETNSVSDEGATNRHERSSLVDVSSLPTMPIVADVLPETLHLLPCGHEQRSDAHFCSVCGAPVPSSSVSLPRENTLTTPVAAPLSTSVADMPPLAREHAQSGGSHLSKSHLSRRTVIVGLVGIAGFIGASVDLVWLDLARHILYIYLGHSSSQNGLVYAVAWSPDGKRIASGSYDKTVQVWDATNGGHIYTYHGHFDVMDAVAWSPNGKRIASGSNDKTIQVWDATDGGHAYIYRGHSDVVYTVAWSPDGKRIASGSNDKTIQVWDATDGGHIYTYRGHSSSQNGFVYAVAWSPDGKRIASGSNDKTIQVWDATDGGHAYTYHGYADVVNAVAWSPDGKHIASGSNDGTVQVWQV